MICEKCWADSYDPYSNNRYERYLELLEERKNNPCQLNPPMEMVKARVLEENIDQIEVKKLKNLINMVDHFVSRDKSKSKRDKRTREIIRDWLKYSNEFLHHQEEDVYVDLAWELANTIMAICDDVALENKRSE